MGVAELKKVELYYHKSVREKVAALLQRSGACQIIDDSAAESSDASAGLRECEEQENHIRQLFRSLNGYYTDPVSSIDRMLGEKTALSMTDLTRAAHKTDLKGLASFVKKAEAALNELRTEVSQLKANAEILSHIKDFPYGLDIFGEGTRTLKGVLGTVQADRLTALKDDLAAYRSETEFFEAARQPKDKTAWVAILYSRTHEREVTELGVKNGVSFAELPAAITGTAAEESAKIKAKLASCAQRETEILDGLKKMASDWMADIQVVSDYWRIMHDRCRTLAASGATERTMRTCFWVPAAALPGLQKQVEAMDSGVAFSVSDPEKDDTPPSLLQNNAFNSPAEALTLLYSPPRYGQRDPSSVMAPFFFLYFGMCLGDAGYALIMAWVLSSLFKKYRKMPKDIKTFMRLFFSGAVATFFYGLFTGGIFADLIDVCPLFKPLSGLRAALTIKDPMQDPMTILGLSLILGVIQLMFGLGVAAYDEYRAGNAADAIGGKASWILFVVGLIMFGGGAAGALPSVISSAGLAMAAVGTCLIFWYAGRGTKNIFMKVGAGFYALYGSTAYLGDILSYCRLLALGLGGGVIGSVINMLAGMIAGVPYVGWLLAAVVVVGGHLFSLAINLLGAFVHAMRLQFVEFFGKFYSGDGSAFSPLRLQTQYVEVCDE